MSVLNNVQPNQAQATTVVAKPNPPKLVDTLRAAAKTNQVFNEVCHMFASRQRARQQITLEALKLRMEREGFNYKRQDYASVLKFMADAGLGMLELDPRTKNIRGLKNIKLTLQSIGQAALGSSAELEKFSPAYDYQKLSTPAVAAPIAPPPADANASLHTLTLSTTINGKPVTVTLSQGVSLQELGELFATLNSERKA